jgi:hypothetical protein
MKKKHVYEMLSAKKHFQIHGRDKSAVTGSVLLVDGQLHTHGPTIEINSMYRDLVKTQKEQASKVYIVATTQNDGEDDNFRDIVLITKSKSRAQRLAKKLQSGKIPKGIETLMGLAGFMDFDGATWFERTLEDLSIWKEQK